jgi:hypothetical protein
MGRPQASRLRCWLNRRVALRCGAMADERPVTDLIRVDVSKGVAAFGERRSPELKGW